MTPTVIRPVWARAIVTTPGHARGGTTIVSGEQHLNLSLPLAAWQRVGPAPLLAKLTHDTATPYGVAHLPVTVERGVVLLDVRVPVGLRDEIRTADVALIATGTHCRECGGQRLDRLEAEARESRS